jgi:UDP-glucose 4-epimerase
MRQPAAPIPQHYLITGGAGFIGSHLCQRLLDAGNHVTALDDLSTGAETNIAQLRTRPGFWFVRDSVENQQTVNLLVSRADRIFHLAAAVGVQLVANEPIRTIRTTVHGTEVVLEAASRYNRPTLITSSSEVYGKGTRVPFAEDDDVVMAATSFSRWCYAYSKGIDEFLGLAYFKQYGLPVVLARLFNTVGPRQIGMYGMVLPRFVQAALANEPLVVYGDGKQTRCFCHVADVVDALIALLSRATPLAYSPADSSPLTSTAGQVFNVGGDDEISMNDLARRVIALADSTSTIQHISYEQAYGQKFDDMMRRVPKLDKIKAAIGFSRRFTLDQIVRSVIDDRRGSK